MTRSALDLANEDQEESLSLETPQEPGRSALDLPDEALFETLARPKTGPSKLQGPQFKGWEATYAHGYPRLYALHRTIREFIPIPQGVPGAEFTMFPSEKEAYERLSFDGKIMANAFKGLEIALYAFAPQITKGIGRMFVGGTRRVQRVLKRKPIPFDQAIKNTTENAVWKGFDAEKATRDMLHKGEKFSKGEADAIYRVLHGENPRVLNDAIIERAFSGKKMSKAWEANVKRSGGGKHGDFNLDEGLLKRMKLSRLENEHYVRLYKSNLRKIVETGTRYNPEKVVQIQLAQLYGAEQASMIKLGDLTQKTVATLIADMIRPRGRQALRRIFKLGGGQLLVPWLNPERVVFGLANAVLRTKDKILDVVVKGTSDSYAYRFDQVFQLMKKMAENGLGKMTLKTFTDPKTGKQITYNWGFSPRKYVYTKENVEAAHGILSKMDDLSELAGRAKGEAAEELQGQIEKLLVDTKSHRPVVAKIVDVLYGFQDSLYKDYLVRKPAMVLRRAGLTILGERRLANWMAENGPRIERVFTQGEFSPAVKASYVPSVLAELRKALLLPENFIGGKLGKNLIKDLTPGKGKGNFPAYLENYYSRVYQKGALLDSTVIRRLAGGATGFFTKGRRLAAAPQAARVDLPTTIETRIQAQANDLFLYDAIDDVSKFASNLPDKWKLQTEQLIAKALNRPSVLDHMTAEVIETVAERTGIAFLAEKTAGTRLGPWFEQFGKWDASRVFRAGATLNMMTHRGLLGIKPFSIMRNSLQPLLTVPADLGGLKDFYFLARGYGRSMSKSHRDYIRSIGAITDFIPELIHRPLVFRHGPKVGKLQLPKADQVYDATLFLYRGSDRANRYVTGGAALEKWDWAARGVSPTSPANVAPFLRKIKAHGRHANVQQSLEDLLKSGRVDDAKALWVNDVIADTQWLYDRLQAPAALRMGGGIGSTAMVFQSWWMNYGATIGKWIRTGDASLKAERLITAMMSAFVVEQIAEYLWGRKTALTTVAFGPLPFDRYPFPPAWKPVWDMMQAFYRIAQGKPEQSVESMKAMLRSTQNIIIPGGHQISKSIQAFQADEWEGFADSIIRLNRDPLYEPFFGAELELGKQGTSLIPPALVGMARMAR